MFQWSSEMNGNSKTKTIESVDLLLDRFAQCLKEQRDGGVLEREGSVSDGRAELRFSTEHLRHTLEVWPRLHPSRKLLQAKDELGGKSVLLLCPHLPDALAADLRSAGINHADLNGRLFIKTTAFLLDREPKRKVYRNPGATLNPFTLKSSRIVRLLLSHRTQEWTQSELESRTGISRASVSLTLGDLLERELVEQTRPGNRHVAALYRVREFNRLLDDWGAEDEWGKRTTIRQYSVLAANLVEVAETARNELGAENVFLTQWFAAHLRHPYTTPPLVSAYLRRRPTAEISWAREVDNGGNLWLIVPRDEGVFQETQTVGGFNLVSDVQIYLDLLPVGQRGPDQARALREWEGFTK